MSATVVTLQTGDRDAVAIGKLCEKAKGTMAQSVKLLIEAGQKLADKKESLAHGEWLPWLKENAGVLGFSTPQTAGRLMKVGKLNAGAQFGETEALQISKQVWGNKPKVATAKTQSSGRSRKAPKRHEKADEIVALADAGATNAEIANTTGVSPRQVRHVVEEETIRREAEAKIDPATLSITAQQKLEAAIRQHKREADAEHAARLRAIDEEVRLRVIAENKDYVAMVEKMEAKARSDQKLWREIIDGHKPLFTLDQFKTIMMCLHPDGQRTPDKLAEAFRLFNSKKLQLTGARQ